LASPYKDNEGPSPPALRRPKPILIKFRKEVDDPTSTLSMTLRQDSNRTKPKTDIADAILINDRIDVDEPMFA
jgi:hypothetical protein